MIPNTVHLSAPVPNINEGNDNRQNTGLFGNFLQRMRNISSIPLTVGGVITSAIGGGLMAVGAIPAGVSLLAAGVGTTALGIRGLFSDARPRSEQQQSSPNDTVPSTSHDLPPPPSYSSLGCNGPPPSYGDREYLLRFGPPPPYSARVENARFHPYDRRLRPQREAQSSSADSSNLRVHRPAPRNSSSLRALNLELETSTNSTRARRSR